MPAGTPGLTQERLPERVGSSGAGRWP
jgi:hypothetical protein